MGLTLEVVLIHLLVSEYGLDSLRCLRLHLVLILLMLDVEHLSTPSLPLFDWLDD